MNLENIMLSEISQTQKVEYCMIPLIGHSEKGTTIEMIKRSMVVRGSQAGVK